MAEPTQEELKGRSKFVTVACKLPHGLWMEVNEPGQPSVKMLARGVNSSDIIGGYGLTDNIPRDFWEAWYENHKALQFVQKNLIWAIKDRQSAQSKAKELAELRHGMEPLNPDAMPENLEKVNIKDL